MISDNHIIDEKFIPVALKCIRKELQACARCTTYLIAGKLDVKRLVITPIIEPQHTPSGVEETNT